MVSGAREDYLTAIWRLTQHGGPVSTSAVARKLGVAAGSATYMFKKMAEAGLVDYREYAGVTLTPAGELSAMGYIRRHRVIERFLVDLLGIPWEQADELADEMEHSLPDVVIDRMEAVMGNPATCPHGNPIPAKDGYLAELPVRWVAELAAGEGGTIARVAEHDPNVLRYLSAHRLVPGERVEVLGQDTVGETYTLRVAGTRLVVGAAVARQVAISA